jgi:sugar/nucleoside kinase (ribokinase family)
LANVANDPKGRELNAELAAQGIEMPCPPLDKTSTSFSIIINETLTGKSTIFSFGGAREEPIGLEQIAYAMRGAEACCVVAPAVSDQIPDILLIADQNRVPVFFGLGGKQIFGSSYELLRDTLVATIELAVCNFSEAKHLTGRSEVADQLEDLQFRGRVRTSVVTYGDRGIHALRDGKLYYVPAYTDPKRPIVDDTGAGDAAQAAIVDSLLRGLPLEIALLAGARQGFEACTALGATTHLLDEAAMQKYLTEVAGFATR